MGDHIFEEGDGELRYRYDAHRFIGPIHEKREPEPVPDYWPEDRVCITCRKVIGLENDKIMGVKAYHLRTGSVRYTCKFESIQAHVADRLSGCEIPYGWSRFTQRRRDPRRLIVRDSEGNEI